MDWFNYHGRDHVPNIVFAVKNKNDVSNTLSSKVVETFEQIGRYGCMAFMVFNIP